MKLIHAIIILLFSFSSVFGEDAIQKKESIAVVKGKYDEVEKLLYAYKIKFDLIDYSKLEKKETFLKYGIMFFPCGIEPPVEDSINIIAQGANISAVTLQKDYREIDKDKINKNVKAFIENGGSGYFSGYSFSILQSAFDIFGYHDNFPYMGLEGRIEVSIKNDLEKFLMKSVIPLDMTVSGWVAVKSVSDSEILAEASYETPRGQKSGPIAITAERGKGNILFTSYYNNGNPEFRRFNVFRTIGIGFLNSEIKKTVKWTQNLSGSVVDAIQRDEYYRMYSFSLNHGNNTLYLKTSGRKFQIDIYDSDMSLIESRDSSEPEQIFKIKSANDSRCFVKIYPSTEERNSMFALIMASGWIIFPDYKKIFVILGAAFLIILVSYALKKIFGKRYLPWIR